MPSYWLLQGNPARWTSPDRLYADPILSWCVTGIERQVRVGDGVLIWMANRDARLRGVHAAGVVSGAPQRGSPGSDAETRRRTKPSVALAIHWYVVHHPVAVEELRASAFAGHQILRMARRTAYPCSDTEFAAAVDLMSAHGPTALPVRPAADLGTWWNHA